MQGSTIKLYSALHWFINDFLFCKNFPPN
jgi:hypothetical protein